MTFKVPGFAIAAFVWLAPVLVPGEELEPKQPVKLAVSNMAQMAIGFEFRQPWNPYWKMRDESQHVLVGRFLRTGEKSAEDPFGVTEFELSAVHKSKDGLFAKGQIIAFPWRIDGKPGDLFGLYTSTRQHFGEGGFWLVPEKIDSEIAAYLASIPVDDQVKRLCFFLRHIESKNATIGFDAYTGLQETPGQQLIPLRGRLPIAHLRNRLLSFAVGTFDDEPTDTYSFDEDKLHWSLLEPLARIVGAAGTREDAEALEKHIRKQPCFRRDALTAAYLVLRGEVGMDLLERDIKEQRAAKIGDAAEVLDLLAATELLCLYPENPIRRQRAVDLAVSALSNPETAAGAIHALATWKEWNVMDRVTELFPPRLNGYSLTRKAIVFYLVSCAEDATSAHAATASTKLNFYKKEHPDLFYAAKTSFDSMGSAWHKRLTIEQSRAPETSESTGQVGKVCF